MAYQHVDRLTVKIWGKRVGVVSPSARERDTYRFQYDPEWIDTGIEVSPKIMPLRDRRKNESYRFSPSDYSFLTFRGLPPMLADAIPDAFGNNIINLALEREGVRSKEDITPLDRLGYIGSRAMGALTFEPESSSGIEPTSIHLSDLVESARSVVTGKFDTENARTKALEDVIAVGTSAGGARAKAVIALHPQTQEMRAGNLPAPKGFEQWLLKFDGVGDDNSMGEPQGFTLTEYAYSLMAKRAGITMSETRLLEEGGRSHFMTRRFDRPGDAGKRLHLQTLCAVGGYDFNHIGDEYRGVPSNRYESYFQTGIDVCGGDDDMRVEMFRRMAFNVLASNCDDHTKNLSFLMNEDGDWSLAPAYDATFAYDPASKWNARHLMSIAGKTDIITAKDMMTVAKEFSVPNARSVIDEVYEATREWPDIAQEVGVPENMARAIESRLASVAVESEVGAARRHTVSKEAPGFRAVQEGQSVSSKSSGLCGAPTGTGASCRNVSGSCPHHRK